MVDWNGLFKWSMTYQDGTHESNFKAMSEEDKKWLEEALKQYTYNDVDRLKEICMQLRDHQNISKDKLVDMLDELLELVEMHQRNNVNLCMCGGFLTLLEIITSHKESSARKCACSVISTAMSNNSEVQGIAMKMGTLILIPQFVKESEIGNKESIFNALSAFLKGENFEGKRRFIKEYDGMKFLECLLIEHQMDKNSLRLFKKVLILLYDLIISDSKIFEKEDPYYVRNFMSKSKNCLEIFIKRLQEPDYDNNQMYDVREYILRIFQYIVSHQPTYINEIKYILYNYKEKMYEYMKTNHNQDTRELLAREFKYVDNVFLATQQKAKQNFDSSPKEKGPMQIK